MKYKSVLILVLVLGGPVLELPAQAPPDGGTRERLISIFIPSMPDAPFTATLNTEWVRPLGDGTTITLKNRRLIARDSSGRIFQERRLLAPENGKVDSVVTQTEISDPTLNARYICVPREHVCQLENLDAPPPALSARKSPAEEKLGTRTIAGVETVGTRQTGLIPPGTIGNDSTIHTSIESWYAQTLGMNLLSIREDPRFGKQHFEMSEVVLGEPDATLFAPPEGSKILDLRGSEPIKTTSSPVLRYR